MGGICIVSIIGMMVTDQQFITLKFGNIVEIVKVEICENYYRAHSQSILP